MQEQDRTASAKELKARAAQLLTQARETNDAWFVEQLSRLAKDLSDFADVLETEAAHESVGTDILTIPPVSG